MAEKFVHQGAVSSEATWPRTAVCIYSGEKEIYETTSKYWNEDKQLELNFRFMQKDCKCKECMRKRADRVRLQEALRKEQDDDGLRALMGYV